MFEQDPDFPVLTPVQLRSNYMEEIERKKLINSPDLADYQRYAVLRNSLELKEEEPFELRMLERRLVGRLINRADIILTTLNKSGTTAFHGISFVHVSLSH